MMNPMEHTPADHGFLGHQSAAAKLKQLKHECDTWRRQLCFMMEENVHLKTRLSEVLKDGISDNLLEGIESFQNRFTSEDDAIGLLRNEVVELGKLLAQEMFDDGIIKKKVNSKMKGLRNSIAVWEKNFTRLKSEFNNYILENV